jgi:hypothetical protein
MANKRIAFIAQPEYFRFIYENDLDNLFIVKEFNYSHHMTQLLFNKLKSFDANYYFFFRGEYIPQEYLIQLKGTKINLSSEPFPRKINTHINFSFDSLKRYLHFRKIRQKSFDYVFHYDGASLQFMRRDGLYLSGEFVFPVATNVYKPRDMEKNWDFFFIGRSTSRREKYFTPLKQHFNFLHICHGIWGEDLVNYINSSRICFNIHAENEVSWEPRLQMLLACGAFVISEPITPNEYLRPGIDYIEVSSRNELIKMTQYYLEHHDEREEISKNGYQRVQKILDSKKVFPKLIKSIDENIYQKFKSERGNLFWDSIDWLFKRRKSFKKLLKNNISD